MTNFPRQFLAYFDERFPFFGFTLPVVLLLYPLIPALVPLYLLPKYYGLHFLYIFLMLFNIRIQRDLAEGRYINKWKKQFILFSILSATLLLIFSLLFAYLERGRFFSDIQFNWRSFFFFLACGSLLLLNWLWYFVGSKLVKNQVLSSLISSFRYPLIIIPPVLLNLHESQFFLTVFYLGAIFAHSLSFELLKVPRLSPIYKRASLVFYTFILTVAAYLGTSNYIFCGVIFGMGLTLVLFSKKLDQKLIFGPTLIFTWGIFFLTSL